ncbi:MAG: hypothetical protein JWO70_4198 [Betaproteobacteria bacterium]|nr:hypothetical protein [Betaproteobacteria bacterium]
MSVNEVIFSVVLAAALLINGPVSAAEPTIDQVYQAAEAGNFREAQGMMDEVLRAHPSSGRAHYVESELLARQGRLKEAAAELRTAERLEPGLPFAKPQAVQALERRIGASSNSAAASAPPASASGNRPAAPGNIPWPTLMIGAALVILVILVMRAMRRRNTEPGTGAAAGPGGYPGAPHPPYPPMPPYGGGAVPGAPGAPASPAERGIGSGILGGLATGAAVGAGVVAGEALAHRLGGGPSEREPAPPEPAPAPSSSDDMGGNDFGISDGSSWDDAGGGGDAGGGSDWT